ncbi:MAG TPA: class I SAM-dependent methyltransferase [Verrucomicrobiae bacterium]
MSSSSALDYCPVLAEMARTRQAFGRSGRRFEDIGALSSLNNLIVLRALMQDLKPDCTLEVGLSFGGSCLVFTMSHRDLGHAPAAQHLALDPFQKQVWDDAGLLAVETSGLSGFLDFRSAFSAVELPRLWHEGRRFGFIYVDGSHLFEDVFLDAYFSVRLLAEGGVVAFDDSSDPHVAKVLAFLRRNLRGALEEFDLSPYRLDGGKSLRYRLGGLLGRRQLTAFRRVGEVVRPWDAKFRPF